MGQAHTSKPFPRSTQTNCTVVANGNRAMYVKSFYPKAGTTQTLHLKQEAAHGFV